jgi:PadR family transcriptional regulator PadR
MGLARSAQGTLVQGTLDLLVLKTLTRGRMHGWGIARHIREISQEVLRVEEGSLYPALRRLELDGHVSAAWAVSENNRRARYYSLTSRGRRQLVDEKDQWTDVVRAIARVLET